MKKQASDEWIALAMAAARLIPIAKRASERGELSHLMETYIDDLVEALAAVREVTKT